MSKMSAPTAMKTVLFIEDDNWLSELYGNALERVRGLDVVVAGSASEALMVLDTKSIDLVVLDLHLGEYNGIAFLHEMISYEDTGSTPVIILTAVGGYELAMGSERWRHYNVVRYLNKSDTKPTDLVNTVKKQLLISGEI